MNYRPTVASHFLDLIKEKYELDSDYKLGKHLKVAHSVISSYRTGRTTFDPYMCGIVSESLNIPFELVLAEIQYEKDKRPKAKRYWKNIAQKFSGKAAALTLACVTTVVPVNDAMASVSAQTEEVCILC